MFLIEVSGQDPPTVRIGKPKPAAAGGTVGNTADNSASSAGGTKVAMEKTIDQTTDMRLARPAEPDPPTVSGERDSEGDDEIAAAPARLGGYRILRTIGRGAMGTVYHAKQLSLDRDVALKTIRGRLAGNPASLARFMREAYAAAQLSHHNVVQIYDFGEDNGQHYFSMEWIRGGSLGDLVREKGSIDPKLAATYILQAARGLQFAHRSGMVHRDIKPANLLLSEDGVVKVADLGLVKVPDQVDPVWPADAPAHSGLQSGGLQSGTQVTMQGTSVGTPAYMAPEQSADASTVDHRADIYSLGCSLFYLLAGRSPYEGTVISEVIQKHAAAPLPDLAEINTRVPDALCQIVARAMAKRPGDRYGSVAEMIDDLQSFLGVESLTGFSPSSDQADQWEAIVAAYSKTQAMQRFSGVAMFALLAVSVLITLVTLLDSFRATPALSLRMILFGPMLFVAAVAAAIAMAASIHKSAVTDHLRRWFGTLTWLEIAVAGFASCILMFTLVLSGLWTGALLGAILGTALGVGFHFGVTYASVKSGQNTLSEARRLVRDLRIEGADEDGLRDFLARYGGKGWQGIYEALFGYDALVHTRHRLSLDPAFSGPTAERSLRDRVCTTLKRKADNKREAIDRRKLAKLEQQSLLSQGISAADARQQSWQMASAIMESAQFAVDQSAKDERVAAEAKRRRIKAMLADARSGQYRKTRDRFAAVKFAFSGFSRLLAGCLLLAAFAFAAQSAGLFSAENAQRLRSGTIDFESLPGDATTDALGQSTSLWSLGIAGCLLCLSAFVSGWRMTPFAITATIIILFGTKLGIPDVGPAKAWMIAAAIGVVVYLPGVIFGEEKHA